MILVSAYHDADLIARAMADHVMAYLVKPIKQADLATTIALAVRRFKEFTALQQQATDLRQALEDRKVIERAKGILMKRAGLDEADAFRRLQKLASDKNHQARPPCRNDRDGRGSHAVNRQSPAWPYHGRAA